MVNKENSNLVGLSKAPFTNTIKTLYYLTEYINSKLREDKKKTYSRNFSNYGIVAKV